MIVRGGDAGGMVRLAPVAVLVVALALRLIGIARESAWCDEALTLAHLPAPGLASFLRAAFAQDPRLPISPLYYLVEYAWAACLGSSLLSLRLLSVALNLAALWTLYALGKRAYGARVALMAMLLGTVSLSQIYYAQEVRFYALLGLLGAFSLLVFLRALESQRRSAWIACAVVNALLLWTHAFALLFIAAQGLAALWLLRGRPGELSTWLLAHGIALAAFAGYVVLIGYDFAAHSTAYSDAPPTAADLARGLMILAGGRFSNEAPAAYMPFTLGVDGLFALLVLSGSVAALAAAARHAVAPRGATILFAAAFAVPVLLLFGASIAWRPCFFARYVFYASYPLLLLAARGMAGAEEKPAPWRYAPIGFAIALGAYQALFIQRPFRPEYRAFAAQVHADPGATKRVLALKEFNGIAAQYSLGPGLRAEIHDGFSPLCREARAAALAGHSVWAVFHQWARTGDFAAEMRGAKLAVQEHQLGGMPPLTVVHVTQP